MIYVIAVVDVVPGCREEFLAVFRDNVPNVLAEDGCLEYAPVVDSPAHIPVQAPEREDVVTVIEKWRDLAALQAHLAAPHMAVYRERVRELVRRVVLHVMRPVH